MPSELKLLKAQCLSDRRNIELSIYGRHITLPCKLTLRLERKQLGYLMKPKVYVHIEVIIKKKSHVLSGYQSKFPFSFSTVG